MGSEMCIRDSFRRSFHELPWKSAGSTARAAAFHSTWRFHGKCHGCGHETCRGSVRGNLRGTNHGNSRKYHGNCHGIFHDHLHIVGIAVGLSVVPRPAVVCRGCLPWVVVEIAVEIDVYLAVYLAVKIAIWLVPWASTVLRYLPRHFVEAHGMSVEARGVSAIARGMPWKQLWNAV